MRWIVACIITVIVGFMLYVRFVPTKASDWHVAALPADPGDYATAGSFKAIRTLTTSPEEALVAMSRIAAQSPRTVLFAGTIEDRMLTYVTRSRVMGFPDYTTVSVIPTNAAPGGNTEPLLMVHGRLRFGAADLGVNRARIEVWLAALGPMVADP